MNFTLTQEEYEALIAYAQESTKKLDGTVDHDGAVRLDAFLRSIEKKNGVTRDAVWVQWQEMDEPLPPGTLFPEVWPPTMRAFIEFTTRLVSRADVDEVLVARARKPTSVLVTRDPGAKYGWTELDKFFK